MTLSAHPVEHRRYRLLLRRVLFDPAKLHAETDKVRAHGRFGFRPDPPRRTIIVAMLLDIPETNAHAKACVDEPHNSRLPFSMPGDADVRGRWARYRGRELPQLRAKSPSR